MYHILTRSTQWGMWYNIGSKWDSQACAPGQGTNITQPTQTFSWTESYKVWGSHISSPEVLEHQLSFVTSWSLYSGKSNYIVFFMRKEHVYAAVSTMPRHKIFHRVFHLRDSPCLTISTFTTAAGLPLQSFSWKPDFFSIHLGLPSSLLTHLLWIYQVHPFNEYALVNITVCLGKQSCVKKIIGGEWVGKSTNVYPGFYRQFSIYR